MKTFLDYLRMVIISVLSVVAVVALIGPIIYATPAQTPYRINPYFANDVEIQKMCDIFYSWQLSERAEGKPPIHYALPGWNDLCLRPMLKLKLTDL